MEIYGNTLVQERTAMYIADTIPILISLVLDESGRLCTLFDFSHLKMKDRDALVDVFQSWKMNVQYEGKNFILPKNFIMVKSPL